MLLGLHSASKPASLPAFLPFFPDCLTGQMPNSLKCLFVMLLFVQIVFVLLCDLTMPGLHLVSPCEPADLHSPTCAFVPLDTNMIPGRHEVQYFPPFRRLAFDKQVLQLGSQRDLHCACGLVTSFPGFLTWPYLLYALLILGSDLQFLRLRRFLSLDRWSVLPVVFAPTLSEP